MALSKLKEGNASENLLNEIHQIIYSLHKENYISQLTKKVYNNLINYIIRYNTKETLYLWILKIVKHLNLTDS